MFKGYTSAQLEDLIIINTHLDAEHEINRIQEATILNNYLLSTNDAPLVLGGDLNTNRKSSSYKTLLRGTNLVEAPQPKPTFLSNKTLDHITTNLSIKKYWVNPNIKISDHQPIFLTIKRGNK